MNDTILGGSIDLSLGTSVIKGIYLGDITPNFTEGTRSSDTLGGNRTAPSGRYDDATLTFTLFVPSFDYLKAIWPDNYNASTPANAGNLIFGTGSCTSKTPVVANLHYSCDDDSRNDTHVFAVLVGASWNPTHNSTDGLSVEVTLYAQPNSDGNYFQLGSGSLTGKTLWDAATQKFVGSSS